ncbi:hypothetical protein [Bacteriophage Eos]|nr:hypothetical protein [Bacteriophage Eos]
MTDTILRLDVAGFYLGALTLSEAKVKYNLREDQISSLLETGELKLRDGLIVLTAL